jgi:hypothetical protein
MIPDQALKSGIENFTHRIYTQGKILKYKLLIFFSLHTLSTLPHWLSTCSHPRKIAMSVRMIWTKEETPWGKILLGIAVAAGCRRCRR